MYLSQLISADLLYKNNSYTFTLDSGNWFNLGGDSGKNLEKIKNSLKEYGAVVKIIRPAMSKRNIVTIIPSVTMDVATWEKLIIDAYKKIGFLEGNAVLTQVEGGVKSTDPGGLLRVGQDVGQAVGKTAYGIASPFLPYLLLLGAGYLFVMYQQGRARRW